MRLFPKPKLIRLVRDVAYPPRVLWGRRKWRGALLPSIPKSVCGLELVQISPSEHRVHLSEASQDPVPDFGLAPQTIAGVVMSLVSAPRLRIRGEGVHSLTPPRHFTTPSPLPRSHFRRLHR